MSKYFTAAGFFKYIFILFTVKAGENGLWLPKYEFQYAILLRTMDES